MTAPAERFFSSLERAARNAQERSGVDELVLTLAGTTVRLRFAGSVAADRFAPAFLHLGVDGANAETARDRLTVDVFDTVSTGVSPPTAPWGPAAVRERGLVAGYCDRRFHTVYQVAVGQLSMLDRASGRAVVWIRDAGRLPMAERAAPLWRLLHAWLGELDRFVVHGAAVGTDDGGVVLAGKGGAGKSTTALACLGSQLRFAGDDYCVLHAGDVPRVSSIYSSAKVHAHDLPRMPTLAPMVSNRSQLDREKALLYLHAHVPDQLIRGFDVRAVVLPRVVERTTAEVRPAARAEVVRALAPSSVLLAPHAGARTLRMMADLTAGVPAYVLEVGSDRESIPRVLGELLAT